MAGDRPQQAVGRGRPAHRAGRALVRDARGARRRRDRELQARHARPVGPRTTRRSRPRTRVWCSCTSPGSARPGPAPTSPGSARSARRWAASATRPAIRTGHPPRAGISLGDSLAALFAVIGTLAALQRAAPPRAGPGGRRRDLRSGARAHGVDRRRLRARRRGPRPQRRVPPRRRAVERVPDGRRPRRRDRRRTPTRCSRGWWWRWRGPISPSRYASHAARAAGQTELDAEVAAWTVTLPADELLDAPRAAFGPGGPHPHRARPRGRPAARGARDDRCGSRRASPTRCRWPAWCRSSPVRPARCVTSGPRWASTPTRCSRELLGPDDARGARRSCAPTA